MRAGSNWRHLNGLSLGMMGDPVRCLPKVVHPDVAALKLQHNHRAGWDEYIQWMVDMTKKFRRTFGPRVKKLDLEKLGDRSDSEDELDQGAAK